MEREIAGDDSSLEEVDDESSMFGKWAMTFRELGEMWAMSNSAMRRTREGVSRREATPRSCPVFPVLC